MKKLSIVVGLVALTLNGCSTGEPEAASRDIIVQLNQTHRMRLKISLDLWKRASQGFLIWSVGRPLLRG